MCKCINFQRIDALTEVTGYHSLEGVRSYKGHQTNRGKSFQTFSTEKTPSVNDTASIAADAVSDVHSHIHSNLQKTSINSNPGALYFHSWFSCNC